MFTSFLQCLLPEVPQLWDLRTLGWSPGPDAPAAAAGYEHFMFAGYGSLSLIPQPSPCASGPEKMSSMASGAATTSGPASWRGLGDNLKAAVVRGAPPCTPSPLPIPSLVYGSDLGCRTQH